jgi:hypothetical protein
VRGNDFVGLLAHFFEHCFVRAPFRVSLRVAFAFGAQLVAMVGEGKTRVASFVIAAQTFLHVSVSHGLA